MIPSPARKNFFFDNTWEQAEYLVKYFTQKRYQAKNYNIEIETAVSDGNNIIIFVNGASGNIFQRAIQFFTKDPFIVYIQTGVKEIIIQNNRTLQDYFNQIVVTVALSNLKNE